MSIKSDISLKYTSGDDEGLRVLNVPVHTDLALKYHTSASFRNIYDNHTYHVYNLNPDEWTIKYRLIDARRDNLVIGTYVIEPGSGHQTFDVGDDIREFYISISAYATTGSIDSSTNVIGEIDTVQYIKRDKTDFDIQEVYGNTELLIDGLNPQRSQNIVTNGLAYNLDHHIDTNFSLRPYTPDYIYEEPAWAQLVDYFEEVLGSRFNIIKQLNQFNTIYDDINLETARKYGVPLEWINSNYIADNILKNKEQIKNLYYLWSKKGNLTALYGALKFFCDVHPYESFREEDLGWFLTDTDGGNKYGVQGISITTFSPDDSITGSTEEYLGEVKFGADATETYYATDHRLAIKLNYYIDAWGVKQQFSQHPSVADLTSGYAYGPELMDSIFRITNNFTPFNAKVYYWWLAAGTNERVNLWTQYVS